jgi:type II secretory pathway pseudopilin PulG
MTLLEVILAMGIAVILALGIYESLIIHYAQADAGRERAVQAQLLRGVLGQLQRDARNIFTGWRPVSKDAGSTGDASDQPVDGDEAPADEEAQAPAEAEETSTPQESSSASATPSDYEVPAGGVLGFEDAVTLIIRRTPAALDFRQNINTEAAPSPVSDLRLVRYWFGSPGAEGDNRTGLVRQEIDYIPDLTAGDDPASGARTEIIAEEVRSLTIRYFDGYDWLVQWDRSHEKTPMAVEFIIGLADNPAIASNSPTNNDPLRYLRLVVASQDIAPPNDADTSGGASR